MHTPIARNENQIPQARFLRRRKYAIAEAELSYCGLKFFVNACSNLATL